MVLFKFENCAPAPELQAHGTGEVDGEVRIVDRWGENKIQFLTANVIVPQSQNIVDLQGLCVGSPKGQLIEYQIVELKDEPVIVAAGLVECIMGGFELPIVDIHFSSCQARFQVRASRQGDHSQYAETRLWRDCSEQTQ